MTSSCMPCITHVFNINIWGWFFSFTRAEFFSVLVGNNTVILRHVPGPMFGICIQKQDGGEKKKKKRSSTRNLAPCSTVWKSRFCSCEPLSIQVSGLGCTKWTYHCAKCVCFPQLVVVHCICTNLLLFFSQRLLVHSVEMQKVYILHVKTAPCSSSPCRLTKYCTICEEEKKKSVWMFQV